MPLSDLLQAPALLALDPADRARAQRLTLAALRGIGRADAIIAARTRRMPLPAVLHLLRLGLAELAAGGAAHGIVNDLVALADADARTRPAKGLINAILRQEADGCPIAGPPCRRPPCLTGCGPGCATPGARRRWQGSRPPIWPRAPGPDGPWRPGGTCRGHGRATVAHRLCPDRRAVQVSALPGYQRAPSGCRMRPRPCQCACWPPRRRPCAGSLRCTGRQDHAVGRGRGRCDGHRFRSRPLDRLRANLARTGLAARVLTADALTFAEGGWGRDPAGRALFRDRDDPPPP